MDTELDKEFERQAGSLITDCEYSAFVLCTPALDEFILTSEVPEGEYAELLRARGMLFLGVIGTINGVPLTALRVPVDGPTIRVISELYLTFIRENFAPKSADWLTRLWELPDTRNEN